MRKTIQIWTWCLTIRYIWEKQYKFEHDTWQLDTYEERNEHDAWQLDTYEESNEHDAWQLDTCEESNEWFNF